AAPRHRNNGHSHNPVGVGTPSRSEPRVARSSQPWALMHNPFGIAEPYEPQVFFTAPGSPDALRLGAPQSVDFGLSTLRSNSPNSRGRFRTATEDGWTLDFGLLMNFCTRWLFASAT